MTLKEKDIEKSERSVFRVFEFATEAIGWLLIVASPLLVGLAIGVIVYLFNQSAKGLVIGIIITLAGLIVGLVFGNQKVERKGNHVVSVASYSYSGIGQPRRHGKMNLGITFILLACSCAALAQHAEIPDRSSKTLQVRTLPNKC